jgi:hypothetical protein
MEYLFDIADLGMRTDPTNPRVVGGAFGDHSYRSRCEWPGSSVRRIVVSHASSLAPSQCNVTEC